MTPCGPGSAAAAAAAMETAKEAWHRQGRQKHNKNQEYPRPTQTAVTRHLLQMTAWSVCRCVCEGAGRDVFSSSLYIYEVIFFSYMADACLSQLEWCPIVLCFLYCTVGHLPRIMLSTGSGWWYSYQLAVTSCCPQAVSSDSRARVCRPCMGQRRHRQLHGAGQLQWQLGNELACRW